MSDDQLNDLLVKFTPLVRATAFRYTGRGAEFEDLLQEGYLALIILIRRCTDRQWLAAYLLNRLPGYVRAAASRIRGGRAKHHFVDIEDIQDILLLKQRAWMNAVPVKSKTSLRGLFPMMSGI